MSESRSQWSELIVFFLTWLKVDEKQFQKILGYISIGKREGAKLMYGGGVAADRGYFIQPTIFGDVQDNMTIAREEVSLFSHYIVIILSHFMSFCLLLRWG